MALRRQRPPPGRRRPACVLATALRPFSPSTSRDWPTWRSITHSAPPTPVPGGAEPGGGAERDERRGAERIESERAGWLAVERRLHGVLSVVAGARGTRQRFGVTPRRCCCCVSSPARSPPPREKGAERRRQGKGVARGRAGPGPTDDGSALLRAAPGPSVERARPLRPADAAAGPSGRPAEPPRRRRAGPGTSRAGGACAVRGPAGPGKGGRSVRRLPGAFAWDLPGVRPAPAVTPPGPVLAQPRCRPAPEAGGVSSGAGAGERYSGE